MELPSYIENFTITLLNKLFQTLLNFKSSVKTQPWNAKLHYKVFYVSWNKETFLMKLNMINCILLVLLLLVSMVLLKCTNVSSSDLFPKLRLIVSSIGTFNYNLARFLCDLLSPLVPNDYSCKGTFSYVSQVKNANLSREFLALRCN